MDRFSLSANGGILAAGEFLITSGDNVKLYDGHQKTKFEIGELHLTSHRLIWHNPAIESAHLSLPLPLVVFLEEETGGLMKSPKIVLHLAPAHGSGASPTANFVKLSFKQGGEKQFKAKLHDALEQKQWEIVVRQKARGPSASMPKMRTGIGGIERSIAQKSKLRDTEISKAFQDLEKLMEMAKPMVSLAKSISSKIRDRQGEVSDDETVQFKSYLLSLGISDPVTRDTHGTGQSYYRELAKEIFWILDQPLQESGGMMTLTDVFCRVNRARGLELLSPEDLLNACKALPEAGLPLRLYTFDTGVSVLQLTSHTQEALILKTKEALEQSGSLTVEELSKASGISVILAKERLLSAERSGAACRDDTVEALRFYPNKFLTC
ncbi:vacuolar protein-sorting-associated protein 36-like isoform X2 [Tigriopus californicus]|uniref:vacuolar protein-sorting-associated protein 36-like isoform X2 n=1 Tax=Tigriopus californicus TaxID=6832 RepID=UPI0027DA41B6|nr:vacuolar protein-sorting-associated protein 36-like isoform X2 [Tigriopus californicus]